MPKTAPKKPAGNARSRPAAKPAPAPAPARPSGVPPRFDGRGLEVWALVYPPGKANANPNVMPLGAIKGDVRPMLPEGTTEWCREGDPSWTPWEEASR
jgi:hypothetical protein